jgi:hypothetical protein
MEVFVGYVLVFGACSLWERDLRYLYVKSEGGFG